MLHSVFSIDGSRYQQWQADLLAYSHRRVGQAGPVTRLWSSDGRPTAFAGRTFRAAPYSPHPVSRDDYAPYNKPSAVLSWLRTSPPTDDTVLLLDPDCVFVASFTVEANRGEPIGQPLGYMRPDATVIARHCRRPRAVQGIGIPIVIHRDDLTALAATWLEKTESIRDDRRSCARVGWVAEMWGYAFAAAELGLRHRRRVLARFPTEDRTDLPLIHYCYASTDAEGCWSWDKRSYRPWRRVDTPPTSTPRAAAALVALVNEFAAARSYRRVRAPSARRRPRGC